MDDLTINYNNRIALRHGKRMPGPGDLEEFELGARYDEETDSIQLYIGTAGGDITQLLTASSQGSGQFLPISGGTLSGNLTVNGVLDLNNRIVLDADSYGTRLPTTNLVQGRIFFLKE